MTINALVKWMQSTRYMQYSALASRVRYFLLWSWSSVFFVANLLRPKTVSISTKIMVNTNSILVEVFTFNSHALLWGDLVGHLIYGWAESFREANYASRPVHKLVNRWVHQEIFFFYFYFLLTQFTEWLKKNKWRTNFNKFE